ncbi:MAG: hypothetical protein GY853_09595 [PVC group bacterium]|nr:hypothetical protein [PVC group bacterium]
MSSASDYGICLPKFKKDDASEVTVDCCTGTKSYNADYLTHESVLTGHREFIDKGVHLNITLDVNIYKESDSEAKRNIYSSYLFQPVKFWWNRNYPNIQLKNGGDAYFILSEVTPYFKNTPLFHDGLLLVFKSIDYVKSDSGLKLRVTKDGKRRVTKDGKKRIIKT